MQKNASGQRQALEDMRLDPHGPGHPLRGVHDLCWSLYQNMPWLDLRSDWREAARSAFVFALSVCQMPKPEGSLGALLNRAFPPGSLPSPEAILFSDMAAASRAMRCSRFDFEDGSGARACELAPLFFGGSAWLANPELARASRLVFCQAMADSCASRAFFDARAWDPPPLAGMEAFAAALAHCSGLEWPGADTLRALSQQRLGEGEASEWPAAQAARTAIALRERGVLLEACPAAVDDGDNEGRSGRRL